MLLNRTTLELARLASKEASRFSMQAVMVDDKQAVVTDGDLMVVVQHPSNGERRVDTDYPQTDGLTHAEIAAGNQVLISSDAAMATLKALPKKSTIPVLRLAALGADQKLYVNTLDSVSSFGHRVEGRYPNWQAVMPKREEATASISFDAKKMKQLCEYFIAVGDTRQPIVKLNIKNAESAMWLDGKSAEGQAITAVLMPCRG